MSNLIQQYAWHILILLLTLSYVHGRFWQPYISRKKQEQSYKEAMDPDRVLKYNQEMSRIRLEQQRRFQEISDQALKERKEKASQRLKDSQVKLEKREVGTGQRLGSRTEYNPLIPSSGMTSNYRPARRCPPGRGGM